MGAGKLVAVADTGPLIHLAEIGCLPLLKVFDELHVPAAVWEEALKPAAIRSEVDFAMTHSLEPSETARFTATHDLERLQLADRECLLLAKSLGIPIILTDDLAVRDAAHFLGTTPVGSLGVVARARQEGLLSLEAAERFIERLYSESSLFVTRAIVELAIERLRG